MVRYKTVQLQNGTFQNGSLHNGTLQNGTYKTVRYKPVQFTKQYVVNNGTVLKVQLQNGTYNKTVHCYKSCSTVHNYNGKVSYWIGLTLT